MIIKTKRMISSGHIVDGNTKCSRLHGHNWFVYVKIIGDIGEDGMVLDFLEVKRIIDELDHKFILTKKQIVREEGNSYIVKAGGRDYVLPKDVCFVINKPFSTSEYLTEYFIEKFSEILKARLKRFKVKIIIQETPDSFSEHQF